MTDEPRERRQRTETEIEQQGRWRGTFDGCANGCGMLLAAVATVVAMGPAIVAGTKQKGRDCSRPPGDRPDWTPTRAGP
jgi:hypothetical protein